MIGTCEIFSLASGALVYTDGRIPCARVEIPDEPADYIIIRRRGKGLLPRARLITMVFAEFLLWHKQGYSHFSAFTELSHRDYTFLAFGISDAGDLDA